jgi:hypothetical protein
VGREKRRPLEFVHSTSLQDSGALVVGWQQPFDIHEESPKGPPTAADQEVRRQTTENSLTMV